MMEPEYVEVLLPTKPKDASALSIKDLGRELETRSLKPSGFWSDDNKSLQLVYNQEFEEELEEAKARREEMIKSYEQANRVAAEREKVLRDKQEERTALATNPRAAFWLKVLVTEKCPSEITIPDLVPPLCRAMCKPLECTTLLCSLDLSHSKIGDRAGSLLALSLCRNKSIKRLELEDCGLGSHAISSFGKLLESNMTLVHISVENNLLCGEDREDFSGISKFFSSLEYNSTLQMLSVWRTGLGQKGGKLLVSSLNANSTLLSVGIGCNNISQRSERDIHALLERNIALKRKADARLRKARDIERNAQKVVDDALDEEKRRVEEEDWLEERKIERAQAREDLRLEKLQLLEEEKRRNEEQRQREDDEKNRVEALKKKKKGKKKKK